jgi:hypothetical protein
LNPVLCKKTKVELLPLLGKLKLDHKSVPQDREAQILLGCKQLQKFIEANESGLNLLSLKQGLTKGNERHLLDLK